MTAILYSIQQQSFHVEPLENYVSKNLEDVLSGNYRNDYKLLRIELNESNAEKAIALIENSIIRYKKPKLEY